MIISLTGFMGCGKTSVGKELAALTDLRHIDLDSEIAARAGKSIPEIFSEDGECVFRELEFQCLREVMENGEDSVLSLGGGTVINPNAAAMVHRSTVCFYLRATADNLRKWLEGTGEERPLLVADKIEDMLSSREPSYESAAHFVIDVNGLTYSDTARHIISVINGMKQTNNNTSL